MRRTEGFVAALMLLVLPSLAQAQGGALRVCSDPNNMPFSDRAGGGFENRIAQLIAHDLGERVQYTYAIENGQFIAHTLKAHKCDVMIGVSAGMDDVATTRPYYSSSYVFVSRKADRLGVNSLSDPRLRKLRIGVHLIGDDNTPPEIALGQEGIVDNVKGFMIDADQSRANPPAALIEAVADSKIDIAAAWGPLAGYFAKHSNVPLAVTPIANTARFAPLIFHYAIAMGVRKTDTALRDRLNAVIAREEPAIRDILKAYGVPLLAPKGESDG